MKADIHAALDAHDLAAARGSLDRAVGDETSRRQGRYLGLHLLERATLRAADRDFAGSASDFSAADKALDVDDLVRIQTDRAHGGPAGFHYAHLRGWTQALNRPIGIKFYERLLLNPFAALARMEVGDASGACVEARRFGVVADYTNGIAPARAPTVRVFGELVAAIACDAANDAGIACAASGRLGALAPVASGSGFAGRCLARSEGKASLTDLWVVIGYGRVSHPTRVAESVLEENARREAPDPEVRSVMIVGGKETARDRGVSSTIDSAPLDLVEALDVDAAAHADYADALQSVEVTILGVKATTGEWSDQAWASLPAHVVVGRAAVSSGAREVVIRVGETTLRRRVEIGPERSRVVWAVVPW